MIMARRSRRTVRRRRRTKKRVTRRRQRGGILPSAALLPALIAGEKAVGLGALSGGAGFGAKKALESATRRRG